MISEDDEELNDLGLPDCGHDYNPGTEECDWCPYSEECEEQYL